MPKLPKVSEILGDRFHPFDACEIALNVADRLTDGDIDSVAAYVALVEQTAADFVAKK